MATIVRDAGTQFRITLSAETIGRYAALIAEGIDLPPVLICQDPEDGTRWLIDGFHRVAAVESLGCPEIDANICSGTLAEAQWLALNCNGQHGLPRTRGDLANAFRALKSHPKSIGMSNREIARHLHTSEPTIRRLRKELSASRDADRLRVVKRGEQIFAMKTETIGHPANIRNRGQAARSFALLREEVALLLQTVRGEQGKALVRIIDHWIDGTIDPATAASAIDRLLDGPRRNRGACGLAARGKNQSLPVT